MLSIYFDFIDMAATIRLMRFGKKGQPFYRIVVLEKKSKRDGAYIEELGSYNPLTKPHTVVIKQDRMDYWTSVGAQLSHGLTKLGLGKKAPAPAEEEPKKATKKSSKKAAPEEQTVAA